MSNKITVIGQTNSGKDVYSSFAHPDHKQFSSADYLDAGELMEDINPGIAKAYYKTAEKALEMETLIQKQAILEKAEDSEEEPEEEEDGVEKASKGEGSKGGKVIGHTKSGKPVYQLTDKVRIKKTGAVGEVHKYGKGENLVVRHFDEKSKAHIHSEHSPEELEKVAEETEKSDKIQKSDMIEYIETGQQFLDWIQKSDVILTEDAYDLLSAGESIETGFWGDLEKAKNLNDLHKVKKLISRGGKTFLATFYEANGDSEEILGEHHELPAGTPHDLKHGDEVEYEHHGQKLTGHIQKFIFHPQFSKHGSVVVKDSAGKKYTKSLRNIKKTPGVPEGNKQAAKPDHDKKTSEEIPYSVHAEQVRQANIEAAKEKYVQSKMANELLNDWNPSNKQSSKEIKTMIPKKSKSEKYNQMVQRASEKAAAPEGNKTASTTPVDMSYEDLMKEYNVTAKRIKSHPQDTKNSKRFQDVGTEIAKRQQGYLEIINEGEALRKKLLGGK